jgi:hypothetical protein
VWTFQLAWHLVEDRLQRLHGHKPLLVANDANRVPQRSAKACERNGHHVPVFKAEPVFEAKHVCAEKVDMQVSRPAVRVVLEVMVLQVRE